MNHSQYTLMAEHHFTVTEVNLRNYIKTLYGLTLEHYTYMNVNDMHSICTCISIYLK